MGALWPQRIDPGMPAGGSASGEGPRVAGRPGARRPGRLVAAALPLVLAAALAGCTPDPSTSPTADPSSPAPTGTGDPAPTRGPVTGVSGSIDVGAEPVALVLDSSAGRAYVSNATDGTLSVIDLAAKVATDTIDAGTRPVSLAIDSGRGLVYVGDVGDDGASPAEVLVVDLASLEVVGTIEVGTMFGSLALDPEAQRAYFLAPEPGDTERLQVIDTATRELGDALVIGNMLGGPLLDVEHGIVFVTRNFGGAVVAVQAAPLEITEEVEVGAVPSPGLRPVGLDSARGALYLSEFEGPLHVLDSASLEVITTMPMGSGVLASVASVAVDPVAGVAYVVKDRAGEVLVIDTTTHEVVDTISLDLPDTGGGPGAAVVDPASGTLYIVDRARDVVHVLGSGTAS